MTLISAGTLSPILTSTISPGTSFSAGIYFFYPSLMTTHYWGKKFLNPSIKASDLALYWKVMVPVSKIMKIKTMAK
jgi:hypothetical protein